MLKNYVDILKVSLESKIKLLDKIETYNETQAEIFKKEEVDISLFDQMIEEKDALIKEIEKLDSGFETLYQRISNELVEHKDKYITSIGEIQSLITRVMDKSVAIQAQEARNKSLVEHYFKESLKKCSASRKSTKVAVDYYKNMSKITVNTPQFLDMKK